FATAAGASPAGWPHAPVGPPRPAAWPFSPVPSFHSVLVLLESGDQGHAAGVAAGLELGLDKCVDHSLGFGRAGGSRPERKDVGAVGDEFLPQAFFEKETGVVGAYRNLHRET